MEIKIDFDNRISSAVQENVNLVLFMQQNLYTEESVNSWVTYSWNFIEYACFDNSELNKDFRMDKGSTKTLDLDTLWLLASCSLDVVYTVTLVEASPSEVVSFDESQEGIGLFASISNENLLTFDP